MSSKTTDMKEGRSTGRKPDITHVRRPIMVYATRACEYGSVKYERANYIRPVAGVTDHHVPTRENLEAFMEYMRACLDHGHKMLDSIERYLAADPDGTDVDAMKAAVYAADTDVTPGNPAPPSMLPHACGMAASLNMGLQIAVLTNLLPEDPGQTWVNSETWYAVGYADENETDMQTVWVTNKLQRATHRVAGMREYFSMRDAQVWEVSPCEAVSDGSHGRVKYLRSVWP